MTGAKNYYSILGVSENASLDEIKKAYRKLAMQHHPDRAAEGKKQAAEEKFKEISEAYYVLSDENRRKEYDALRKGYAPGAGGDFAQEHGFDFDEILKHFRGARRSGRGASFYGGTSGFEDIFDIFEGMGSGGASERYVFSSGGSGDFRQNQGSDIRANLSISAQLLKNGGEAKFKHQGKDLTLKIKPGTQRGQKLRLKGQGQICPCCNHPGDLIVNIV